MSVKIKDLVDEMEMETDEYRQYLNRETGEIVTTSTEELSIAEDSEEDDDFSKYPDWQRKGLLEALDIIVNWKNYIELPDKYEINEYNIMEEFCDSIEDNRASNALYTAIQGKGAFRRFKDTVIRYGIEKEWYRFREEALKDIAINWCERNDISYHL